MSASSTLTAFVEKDDQAYILNVGNSRIYSFGGDDIERLTEDHTREGDGKEITISLGGEYTRDLEKTVFRCWTQTMHKMPFT